MNDRFYVRLTDEEQLAAFVNEFQRRGLKKIKQELLEYPGRTIKDIMIGKGEWDSFSEECGDDGEDPDVAAKELEEMARNVSDD